MARQKKERVNIYDDLRGALTDAIAYERGEPIDLRVRTLSAPPKPMKPQEIRRIREDLNASQSLFAQFLCVSTKAVQAWEQGTRRPNRTALRLLGIAKTNPSVLVAPPNMSRLKTVQARRSVSREQN